MKLKNYLKISALSLGLLALAVTSCGGGSGSSNGVSGSKSGRTDYNVEVAKKNVYSNIEEYLDPAKLSKKIEKIEAMSDEAAKNYIVKKYDDFCVFINSLLTEEEAYNEFKKLNSYFSFEPKNDDGEKQVVKSSLEQFKQFFINLLDQRKKAVMLESATTVKQLELKALRDHLQKLQNK
ncbi:hypothetical protein [Spirobacillus cienkowskii]|uniref:hypothetical protein n=1 Tax=Spirobacillus cienkowskii TaxID=495820 RepID=UPI0030CDB4BE